MRVRGGGDLFFLGIINGTLIGGSLYEKIRIGIESLLEHFIFQNFLGGGPPIPPQGEVTTHKYSHHKISNPPFTNPI